MLKNKQSPVAILTTLKLICSRPVAARYLIISGMVVDDTLCRCVTNGFSHVLNFFCNRGSNLPKSGNFNPRNSKPEVDIDFVPTAFERLRTVLKCNIINFGQVAPQVRVNWQSARSSILWVHMFELDLLLCFATSRVGDNGFRQGRCPSC